MGPPQAEETQLIAGRIRLLTATAGETAAAVEGRVLRGFSTLEIGLGAATAALLGEHLGRPRHHRDGRRTARIRAAADRRRPDVDRDRSHLPTRQR